MHMNQMIGQMQNGGGGGESMWLRALRTCFPMDDRAFDFLMQQPVEIQEGVIMEFRPRRDGDLDYSGAITSFVRAVSTRGGGRMIGPTGVPQGLVEAFRRRYPHDDRAWEYLTNSQPHVQRSVIEKFRPKQEGERDYSALITRFVKSHRNIGFVGS